MTSEERAGKLMQRALPKTVGEHIVEAGETAWSIANLHGVSLEDLKAANKHNQDITLDILKSGDAVQLPESCFVEGAVFPELLPLHDACTIM
jgi:LysM repeat protein